MNMAISPGLRVAATMAILFCAFGCVMPFMPLWLAQMKGFSGLEIAIVMSSAVLARPLVGIPLALLAEAMPNRRTPIVLTLGAGTLAYVLIGLVDGLAAISVLMFCALTMTQTTSPLLEGASMRAADQGGMNYGQARAIGSAMFIFGNLGSSVAIEHFGPQAALVWVQVSCALATMAALALPAMPSAAAQVSFRARLRATGALLLDRPFTRVLAAAGIIQASHAFFYVAGTNSWLASGLSEQEVGILWAFGVIVEIAFLAGSALLLARFGPVQFMLIGGVIGLVRWTASAFTHEFAVLFALQALHAATFAATHVGALTFLKRRVEDHMLGTALALYTATAAGTFMGMAQFASGWLSDIGPRWGWLAMAGLCALGLILLPRALWQAERQHRAKDLTG